MIQFIFRIVNPKPNDKRKQHTYVAWDKRLSENWATELQISKWPMHNFVELHIDTSWSGGDHAGPMLGIEFFGWFFNFKLYNVNHWNWEEGRFYTKAEAVAEWSEDQDWREDNDIEQDPDDKYAMWKEKEYKLWKDTVYPIMTDKESK
jgi:hypothetical protein